MQNVTESDLHPSIELVFDGIDIQTSTQILLIVK